jgi:HSP20 family protein
MHLRSHSFAAFCPLVGHHKELTFAIANKTCQKKLRDENVIEEISDPLCSILEARALLPQQHEREVESQSHCTASSSIKLTNLAALTPVTTFQKKKMSFLVDDSSFPMGVCTLSGAPMKLLYHCQYEPTEAALAVQEDETGISLSMDLPGVRPQDLDVSVGHGVLSINGCRIVRGIDGRIRKRQRLARRFAVDTDAVDVTQATVTVLDGVLIVYAPKKSKGAMNMKHIPVTTDEFDYELLEEFVC